MGSHVLECCFGMTGSTTGGLLLWCFIATIEIYSHKSVACFGVASRQVLYGSDTLIPHVRFLMVSVYDSCGNAMVQLECLHDASEDSR